VSWCVEGWKRDEVDDEAEAKGNDEEEEV